MKRVVRLVITFGVLMGPLVSIQAQEKIDYQLCGMDFRPISMHSGLPANPIYANPKAPAEARALDVVKRLSFEEKLELTGGYKQFHYPGIPRLGIPPVYFSDATQGVHQKDFCVKVGETTAFPSGQALAATWDRTMAYAYAEAISEECRGYGVSVLLGPGLNLYRNSQGGRNFEYFGEDPFLASQIGVAYVRGMQSMGTIATVKHFLGNEQEVARHDENSIIGERALHELYLAPFKAAIEKGGALAVMTGNNMVNGYPGAADTPLSQGVVRDKWGFKGVIMSDWANSMFWPDRQKLELTSGHSLLMENNAIFARWVHSEIEAHPEEKPAIEKDLDRMVTENLYSFFKAGVYDRPYRNPSMLALMPRHKAIALKAGEEAITLLKNADHVLPIEPGKAKKIAVVGTDEALTVWGGGGSGAVAGYDHVDFLTGLKKVYGDVVVRVNDNDEAAIRSADVVLYFVAKKAGEGSDVPYEIPGMTAQVDKYAALNKNLVMIISGGNGFPMPWLNKVKGLVFAYFLGQERGNALASILSGAVSPSGKLPFTIEKTFADSPAFGYNKLPDGTYYWGGGRGNSKEIQAKFGAFPIRYKEGPFIGYRWYQKKGITPLFPFGYGLSYTTFRYAPLKVSSLQIRPEKPVIVRVKLTNTGRREAAEVAQLYVNHANEGDIERPVRELKGFARVDLQAGETRTIEIPVSVPDLAYWDVKTHGWKSDHGTYRIDVGASSSDIQQSIELTY